MKITSRPRFGVALALGIASCAAAHPGSGIVVDDENVVWFVCGPHSTIYRAAPGNEIATPFLVGQVRGEQEPHVPHHLFLDGASGLITANDHGSAILRIDRDDASIQRIFPPDGWESDIIVGGGGDPFLLCEDGSIFATIWRSSPRTSSIVKLSPQGQILMTIGDEPGHADGDPKAARLGGLHGAAFILDDEKRLLFTDSGTWIRRVSADGAVETLAGGPEHDSIDGPADRARFQSASGLALDEDGNLHIADAGARRIRMLDTDSAVSTIAGSGARGNDDGPAAEATFEYPTGLALDTEGNLYILDLADGRDDQPIVRRLSKAGQVTTIARVSEQLESPADAPFRPPMTGEDDRASE